MSTSNPTTSGSDGAMALAKIQPILDALASDATQYDFYNILRQFDAVVSGPVPLGRAPRPQNEPLRLTQHASLSFAPAS